MASNSSMNRMQGLFRRAVRNISSILEMPSVLRKSDPTAEMNAAPDSKAMALANMVLPMPGAPYINMPVISLAPAARYFSGFLILSIQRFTASLTSSLPKISVNRTWGFSTSRYFLSCRLASAPSSVAASTRRLTKRISSSPDSSS